jgi:hypothetical protein
MNSHSLILVLALALSASANDENSLPLPRWSEEELRAMQSGGAPPLLGLLLNPDAADRELAPFNLADSPDQHQPASDLSLFLPQSLLTSGRDRPSITLLRVIKDVSEEFINQASEAAEAMLLLDPNGELHESAHEEFQHFLEFHARDSRIALHVLLMGKNEQLPPDVDLAALAGGNMKHGAGVVVVPMGDVERTRLFLSRDVIDAAAGVDLNELLADVVKQAQASPEADEQLHRLLVRLSVRLFWLERKLPAQQANETVLPAIAVSRAEEPMLEVGTQRNASWSITNWLIGLAAMGGVALFVNRRWQRHRHRTHEWTLPEMTHLTPRLGGTHCGGAVGVAWN